MNTSESGCYAIHIKGCLDLRWSAWFEGLTLIYTGDGDTILHGPVADQAALHGLLARVRDLNLTLVSVTPCDA
jgi:hypothetical protein